MRIKEITKLFLKELKLEYHEPEIKNLVFYTLHEIMGFSRTDIVMKKEEDIEDFKLTSIIDILEKLKQNIPIQYILGTAEFYGLPFIVNPDVLIPRPETEELVDWIIKENKNTNARIIDIGTGSGCIAIALKKNIPSSKVYATDISTNALKIAKENALNNKTEINFKTNDILNSETFKQLHRFDIIVSNPPYVRLSEKDLMKNNVLNNEPHIALFVSDEDAFVYYKAIADFALMQMNPNGELFFEINENLCKELILVLHDKGLCNIIVRKDINGKDRMLKCSLAS